MTRRRRAVAAAGFACIMHVLACANDGTHVFTGRLFVEARDCLATPSSLDVLPGGEPGTCEAACLLQTRPDGGQAAYVSTMCPPFPSQGFDTSGRDARCARALAAFARNDTCLSDGGTTHPRGDASPDGG